MSSHRGRLASLLEEEVAEPLERTFWAVLHIEAVGIGVSRRLALRLCVWGGLGGSPQSMERPAAGETTAFLMLLSAENYIMRHTFAQRSRTNLVKISCSSVQCHHTLALGHHLRHASH